MLPLIKNLLFTSLSFVLFLISCVWAERVVHMNQRWDVFRPTPNNTSDAYILFKAFYKSSSYIQAEEYCIQYNAHLASFHTEQEFEFIADITKRFYGWAYNDFWLGLFHRGELLPEVPNHRLYFLDGSAYNITKFSATEERHSQFWIRHLDKWNSYRFEPDHYSTGSLGQSGSEYCVALSHVDYKLFDQNCSVPSSFVCRYDGPTVKGVDISEKTNSQPFLPPKTAALTVEITAESESSVKSSVGSVRNQPDPTRNNPPGLPTVETQPNAIIQPSFMLTNNTWLVFMVVDGHNANGLVLIGVFLAITAAVCSMPMVVLASVGFQLKRIRKKHSGSYSPPRNV